MGKCATFSPTSTTPSTKIYNTTTSLNYVNEDFSWSIWINPSSTVYGTSFIFTVGRADAGGYGYGADINSSGTVGCWFGSQKNTVSVSFGTWTHLAFTRQGTTIKIYKNGSLASTHTFSGTIPTYSDGNGVGLGCFHYSSSLYAYNGSLNDFRIYNHCLSPKEVKEISKGLVLHYPMNNCSIEANNLLNNASSYREGTPYKCTTTSTDGYFHTNMYYNNDSLGGQTVTFSVNTNKQIASSHSATTNHDKVGLWLYLKKTAYSSANGSYDAAINLNSSNNNFKSLGNNRYSWTYAIPSGYKGVMIRTNLYSNDGSSVSANFWDFQLEFGSKASPFSSNKWTSTTVYDCSGFGNNGSTTSTTAPITNSDTTRYGSAWGFNGTNYITLTNLPTFVDMSVSFWMKPYSSGQTACLINYRNAVGNDLAIFLIGGNVRFDAGGQTQFANYAVTTDWQHVCVVFNNSTSKKQLYINGVLKQEVTVGSSIGVSSSFGTIGSSSNGSASTIGGNVYSGILSDYRIYATPLSAEDVKELYNTSAMVCDNGTVMAYSLEE